MDTFALENIGSKIFEIRGQKVMLDRDLAELYQVETKRLNEQVRRNMDRFPSDLMFELSDEEFENLRSQNATSSWGGRRYSPKAFTEQGVYMLATVLKSKIATEVTLSIMRTFTALRRYALTYDELAKKIEELESRMDEGENTDKRIIGILNKLMEKDDLKKVKKIDKIGFKKNKAV